MRKLTSQKSQGKQGAGTSTLVAIPGGKVSVAPPAAELQPPVLNATSQALTKADIDRKGVIEATLDDYKIQVAMYEAENEVLKQRILGACANVGASDLYADEGELYRLLVGAKAEEQKLQPDALPKILGWLGQDLFLRIVDVTFKRLEAVLTPEQYAEVVKKEHTGRRTIKIVPKAAPTPLKAA